jgi:1,4-dihydroxy-2-naphthoate octaprenyltransferase
VSRPADWWHGARPRTLPAAVAPVLVGTAAAAAVGAADAVRALLALGVALALQVGVNYANDYSDGVRGTDSDRVGPMRLVASGTATPAAVRAAALLAFGTAGALGLVLVALSGEWWLLAVGALSVAAAWYYTGGRSPYGYRGLGEVAVFVFFGLVATLGTTYVQALTLTVASVLGALAVGCLATAILVANNLRDRPRDEVAGKRTLAVRLGDARTRGLFVALAMVALAAVAAIGVLVTPWALLGWACLPWLARTVRTVRAGAGGAALVPVLVDTGRAELVLALGLALGLVLG